MICKFCGTKVDNQGFTFCPQCGHSFERQDVLSTKLLGGRIYADALVIKNTPGYVDLLELGDNKNKGLFNRIMGPSKQEKNIRKLFHEYCSPTIFSAILLRHLFSSKPNLSVEIKESLKRHIISHSMALINMLGDRIPPEDREATKKMHESQLNNILNAKPDKLQKQIWLEMFDYGIECEQFGQFFKGYMQLVSLIDDRFVKTNNEFINGKRIVVDD